jgi:hypothetical protein
MAHTDVQRKIGAVRSHVLSSLRIGAAFDTQIAMVVSVASGAGENAFPRRAPSG